MSTFFDRTPEIKELWQADLARVYKETNDLLAPRFARLFANPFSQEELEELEKLVQQSSPEIPKVLLVAVGLTPNLVQIISTGVLYVYLKSTRPVLFDIGKIDITEFGGYEFFSSITPTAAEIYDGLRTICPVAVPLLIEKIEGCSLSSKETLKKTFQDQDRDAFIECLNNLDCDLSTLRFYSMLLSFERWLFSTMVTNPQAFLDFVYHRDLGNMSEIFRATSTSEQELSEVLDVLNGSSVISSETQSPISEENAQERMNEAAANSEQMMVVIKNILKIITQVYRSFEEVLFPFEKEYYANLLELPFVRPVVAEIEEELEHEDELSAKPELSQGDDSFSLPKNFFKLAKDNSNSDEYFKINHAVVSAGSKPFRELIDIVVAEGFIDPDDRTKQLFTYVLTGRWKPENYQRGETIVWHHKENKENELCYIIKSLIASDQGKKATKYKKMRILFSGPNWNNQTPDKDKWKSADPDFKKALHEQYPELCKV